MSNATQSATWSVWQGIVGIVEQEMWTPFMVATDEKVNRESFDQAFLALFGGVSLAADQQTNSSTELAVYQLQRASNDTKTHRT